MNINVIKYINIYTVIHDVKKHMPTCWLERLSLISKYYIPGFTVEKLLTRITNSWYWKN